LSQRLSTGQRSGGAVANKGPEHLRQKPRLQQSAECAQLIPA